MICIKLYLDEGGNRFKIIIFRLLSKNECISGLDAEVVYKNTFCNYNDFKTSPNSSSQLANLGVCCIVILRKGF